MIIKKDSKIVKAKVERKSLALKAKKESSDEECSISESEDEEYAMVTRTKEHLSEVLGVIGEEDDEKVNNEMCLVAQASSKWLCDIVGVAETGWFVRFESDLETQKLVQKLTQRTQVQLLMGK
ncbi:hypothetical protein Tco_1476394 [Tanacetum coccineum]